MNLFVSQTAPITRNLTSTSPSIHRSSDCKSLNFETDAEIRPSGQKDVSFVATPPIHVASRSELEQSNATLSKQEDFSQEESASFNGKSRHNSEHLARGCTHQQQKLKIRSTGLITGEETFPFADLSSSTESEIENVPTTESEAALYSPIDHYLTHHEPIQGSSKPRGLRQSFYSSNVLPRSALREISEERLARWRPPGSQHNTEEALNGKHPYDKDSPELENPLSLAKRLFGGDRKEVSDPQQQKINHRTINDECKFCIDKEPQINILSSIPLANNSSLSMLQQGISARTHHQSSQALIYTPKAVPMEPTQLNYTRGTPPEMQSDYYEEMRDVFDEVDDICIHCLNSIATFFTGGN